MNTASRSRHKYRPGLRAQALAGATALAAATLGLLLTTSPWDPAGAAVVPGTATAAAAASTSGAAVPGMAEYEAEGAQAATDGKVIGPDYTQGDLATEASGRQAVQLTAQGQYLQFTLSSAANALDLHYAVPQGASGRLSVYVNGTRLGTELPLTSAYSYISTGITGSRTHKLYDDARLRLPSTVAAGSTVKFQVDAGDTALPYTLDVADFFDVAAPAAQPAGSVSVVSEGADASGSGDSTNAFRTAIAAAASAGVPVWIPQGTFRITSALQVAKATFVGAGSWYSQLATNEFINNGSAVSGPVNLSGFAILGSTVGRHDDSSANAVNGSLGSGATVDGLWIQDTNVGFWLQYGNSGITVKNCVVLSTDADGLNFNGNASNDTVTGNFLRNTGDDGLALWSMPSPDTGITLSHNTVVQPTLANGIAVYGGSGNTVTGNTIADTNALGSGIAVSNQAFLSPFTPLSGTTTVSDNTLIRTGALNPNWGHAMGAMRFDSFNSAFTDATVNVSGNAVYYSPYEAFEIVSGGGSGYAVSGLVFSNNTVNWTGTTVFQAETTGSASVSGLTASNVKVAGAYNYGYPNNSAGTFAINQGSGNSGWSTAPVLTAFPTPTGLPPTGPAPTGGGTPTTAPPTTAPPTTAPPAGTDLALRATVSDTGHTQNYTASNTVDGNADTYWESTDNAFPQSLTVDLGATHAVGRLVLTLPPATAWSARTETFSVLGSTDNGTYTTLTASAGHTFDPATGNTVTVTLPSGTAARYLRLTFTGNTGWPAGQLSGFGAFAS
ncbi:discoidin domain-containing protein [Streptacidiphilus carbonis]|uniref:discoidin domain-containing protein n=1 Tax=Streptacidiphilus carbonis TaxID=105422 RepID=UPI000A869AE1|nr:discoidin domain-containing protein [Streptacidiphilus carbonis]